MICTGVPIPVGVAVVPIILLSGILLACHTSLGKLLHHFDEFLAIVFQQVVGNGQDSA